MNNLARSVFAGLTALLVMTSAGKAVPVAVPAATVVQAPDWSVGSEWYYSDGYGLKVTSVSLQGAVFDRLDAPGQWFSRQGFIRKDAISGTATRNSIYLTVPDNAGVSLKAAAPLTFQREYMSNGKLMVHASSWTVEGHETITVPAGTFDCWLIVWRTRSLRSDWTGFERWWYSPKAQNYVRMEYKYGAEPSGSRVLMRYNLAAAEAAPQKALQTAPQNAPPKAPQEAQQIESPPQHIELEPKPAPAPLAVKVAEVVNEKVAKEEAPRAGPWHAQIGSSRNAVAIKQSLRKMLQANAKLRTLPSGVSAHNLGAQGTYYRAWLGAYDTAEQALGFCRSLKVGKSGCAVFKNPTVLAKAGP